MIRDALGRASESLSAFLEEHWQSVRLVNGVVFVVAAGVWVKNSRVGYQFRRWKSFHESDFLNRRRFRAQLTSFKREGHHGLLFVEAVHLPPVSWLFGIRWPLVSTAKEDVLKLRIFGIQATKDPILPSSSVSIELLFMENGYGVGHVLTDRFQLPWRKYPTPTNTFALDLVKRGAALLYEDESPGKYCSDKLEDIQGMDAYLQLIADLIRQEENDRMLKIRTKQRVQAVQDSIETISDGVDRAQRTISEVTEFTRKSAKTASEFTTKSVKKAEKARELAKKQTQQARDNLEKASEFTQNSIESTKQHTENLRKKGLESVREVRKRTENLAKSFSNLRQSQSKNFDGLSKEARKIVESTATRLQSETARKKAKELLEKTLSENKNLSVKSLSKRFTELFSKKKKY